MNRTEDRALTVLDALYGDGAWEISKALSEKQRHERTQARVGLASNVVGLAAGTAALVTAAKNPALKRGAKLADAGPMTRFMARKFRVTPTTAARMTRAGAAGAVGLQATNTVGDVVANRVLARESKKGVVKKADSPSQYKMKALKAGVNTTASAAKAAPAVASTASNALVGVTKAPIMTGKKMAKIVAEVNSPDPAVQVKTIKKSVDLAIKGEVSKMNTELKQVFGWASVIEVNGEPVIDLQGDVMTIDTIEKAAYNYVHSSRKGGRQHARVGEEPLHVSDMIESFVLTPEKKEQMGLPDTTPTGWWVGFQINDDDTWQQYKDGKLKEFSIHGSGTRKALEL